MGIAFLAPLFFAALAAVAVPVLLHLRERERDNVVEFPSLMFLRRIPYRSVEKRRIRHWLLLTLRALAIVLLVAAFTRPFFEDAEAAPGSLLGPREVVLVLDRSYSMAHEGRWASALEAARQVVASLRAGDRGSLVLLDRGAAVPVRSASEPLRLSAALDTLAPGDEVTRFGPALKAAQTILEETDFPNRELVLISDFQRAGWTGDEGVTFPPGTEIRTVAVGGDATPDDRAVTDVRLRREPAGGRERVTVTARVVRAGGEGSAALPVTLEVDGRALQVDTVTLAPDDARTITFAPFTLADRFTRGTVRLPGDALAPDDALHFVLSPERTPGILVLEGRRARADASLYLTRALEIGERAPFRVEVRRSSTVGADDLQGRELVIVNDAPLPGGEGAALLRRFVEDGGGLLVVLGERSSWRPELDDLAPARVEAPVDHDRGGAGRMGHIDYAHPVFELFAGPRSGDFTRARFFRSRPLTPADSAVVVARLDDGSPVLVERRVGRGRVMVWASTLDAFWNDLALQPVYLPFVHALARHLTGVRDQEPWFRVGRVIDLADPEVLRALGADEEDAPLDEDLVALLPDGAVHPLPAGGEARFLTLSERGFYTVRAPGSSPSRPLTFAVNVDPAEADLAPGDPAAVAAALSPRDGARRATGLPGSIRPEDRERRQGLWRYLLLAALALLVTETALSNWMSRRAEATIGGAGHA
ncbi:MAG: VWA domain-containing protein [Gemmatimonadetes bacterium]|nr:MAG: VWA domain-containing protein [Gemmatimonadota bacterium]